MINVNFIIALLQHWNKFPWRIKLLLCTYILLSGNPKSEMVYIYIRFIVCWAMPSLTWPMLMCGWCETQCYEFDHLLFSLEEMGEHAN